MHIPNTVLLGGTAAVFFLLKYQSIVSQKYPKKKLLFIRMQVCTYAFVDIL